MSPSPREANWKGPAGGFQRAAMPTPSKNTTPASTARRQSRDRTVGEEKATWKACPAGLV